MRYLMNSAMVIISSLCRFANFVSSGTRAIVPSSFMISQITPAASSPPCAPDRRPPRCGRREPARRPCARSGNMCPGRARSEGFVLARSRPGRCWRGRPRKYPCSSSASLRSSRRMRSRAARCSVDHQRNLELVEALARHRHADDPRPCFAMKLIAFGVAFSAATSGRLRSRDLRRRRR